MKWGVLLLAGLVTAAVAAAAFVGAAGPSGAKASSHREAPVISDDPAADNTDVFAFVSPDRPDTVTIIADYIPFEDPAGGPNYNRFDPTVLYELNVDNDGDAVEDVTYQFRFRTSVSNPNTFLYNTGQVTSPTDPDLNVKQTYSVTRVTSSGSTVLGSNLPVPPANIGPRSNPTYDPFAGVVDLGSNRKVFAGPRDDPFFVDLGSIFDLGGLRPFNSLHVIPLDNAKGVDGVRHRSALDTELRQPRRCRGRHASRRDQGLRRPARRPVLRRSGLDLRPGRAASVQHGAPDPARDRGGQGRCQELQHARDRDPGAEDGPAPDACR
jgi:hypothetical protein